MRRRSAAGSAPERGGFSTEAVQYYRCCHHSHFVEEVGAAEAALERLHVGTEGGW